MAQNMTPSKKNMTLIVSVAPAYHTTYGLCSRVRLPGRRQVYFYRTDSGIHYPIYPSGLLRS